jgi:hypothetical protein
MFNSTIKHIKIKRLAKPDLKKETLVKNSLLYNIIKHINSISDKNVYKLLK